MLIKYKGVKTMDKIKDIVSSLIPEEQQADIIAKIDGEVTRLVDKTTTDLKNELSSKYKVNLFEEDVEKAFTEKTFIPKSLVKEQMENLTIANEELEAIKIERDELKKSLEKNTNIENLFNSQINLVSNGLRPDRLELVKPHLKGDKDEDLTFIKETYPELFGGQKERNYFQGNGGEGKTGLEKYIEEQKNKK
jgi:hypothetical protein